MDNLHDAKVSASGKGKSSNFKVPALEEIREARKNRLIITMLCVYGDDSSDEKGVRTFAVAGVAGTQEEWDIIGPAWIKATEGRIFHATDNQSQKGVYKDIAKAKCDEEYIKLTDILVKSKIFGIGHVIDITAFKENLPDSSEDAPYYHCFSHVIMGFAQLGYMSIPREKVKFTFDRNYKIKYNSNLMLDYLETLSEYNYSEYIEEGEVSFASRKMIQIQAADLFAYEVMKELDNQIGPNKRYRRKPLIALKRIGRFRWAAYTRRVFEFIRKKLESLEKEDNLDWRQEYQEWLMKTKRKVDNDSNRMSYMLYLWEEMEKEKKGGQAIVSPVASTQGGLGCD